MSRHTSGASNVGKQTVCQIVPEVTHHSTAGIEHLGHSTDPTLPAIWQSFSMPYTSFMEMHPSQMPSTSLMQLQKHGQYKKLPFPMGLIAHLYEQFSIMTPMCSMPSLKGTYTRPKCPTRLPQVPPLLLGESPIYQLSIPVTTSQL